MRHLILNSPTQLMYRMEKITIIVKNLKNAYSKWFLGDKDDAFTL